MGVNSLPKTVTRQRRDCDLNPGSSAPESSTLTTRLPSHPGLGVGLHITSCNRHQSQAQIGDSPAATTSTPEMELGHIL